MIICYFFTHLNLSPNSTTYIFISKNYIIQEFRNQKVYTWENIPGLPELSERNKANRFLDILLENNQFYIMNERLSGRV